MAFYLDTSALVKLVVAEPESAALRAWAVERTSPLVTSDLARTELLRAVRRAAPDRLRLAREVLDALVLVTLAASDYEQAARLDPIELRTLDALHLAAALRLGDDLEGIVAYDARLGRAAGGLGLAVVAPRT